MRTRAERLGFTALGFPAFRTFFATQLLVNTAQFVQGAGIGWTSWLVTGSAGGVALIGFLGVLPYTLLTLHAGLLTDRYGARRMLVTSYLLTGAGVAALGLGAVAWGIPFAVLAVASFVLGLVAAIGGPAGFTVVNELVPPHAVPSAVALIFLDVNLGRVIGGALAGVTLALLPGGWTLVLAGLMLALPALAIVRLPAPATPRVRPPHATGSLIAPLRDAASEGLRHPLLGTLFLATAVLGSLGQGYNYQLPLAAVELGHGPDGLGLLNAAVGVGGLVVGLTLERLMRGLGHGRVLLIGMGAAGLGMTATGLAGTLAMAVVAMAVAGAGFAIFAASTISVVQALAPAAMRGRLTALFSLLYWGMMPLGAIIGGLVAEQVGALATLRAFGVAILVVALAIVVRRPTIARLRLDREPARVPA